MDEGNNKEIIWNKAFVLLFIINGLQSLGFQLLVPNLPVYALRFTASETLLGVLGASIAFAALLTRPFSAYLADRGDRKRIIVTTQAFMAVSGLGLLIAPNIQLLIAFRMLQGLLFSIVSTVVISSGIQTLPSSKLGYGVGIMSLSNIGCQAVAPAFGIFIAERLGYPSLFIFIVLLSVASGVAAFLLKGDAVSGKQGNGGKRVRFRDVFAVDLYKQAIVMFLFVSAIGAIFNFLLLYGHTAGLGGIGYYFTIFAGVIIAIRLIGGSLLDRFYYGDILVVCAALCAAGLLALANAQSFAWLAFSAALMGVGYGYANPAIQAEMVRRVDADRVGVAIATSFVGMDAAHVAAPVIMGVIVEGRGYRLGFSLFCLPLAIAAAIALYERGRNRMARDGE